MHFESNNQGTCGWTRRPSDVQKGSQGFKITGCCENMHDTLIHLRPNLAPAFVTMLEICPVLSYFSMVSRNKRNQ